MRETPKFISAGLLKSLINLSGWLWNRTRDKKVGEFFLGYGLFLAKLLTFFIFLLAVIFILSMLGGKGRRENGSITVTHINELLDNNKDAMYAVVLDGSDLKNTFKNKKKQKKLESKEHRKASKIAAKSRGDGETIVDEKKRKRMFVLDFKGDIKALSLIHI